MWSEEIASITFRHRWRINIQQKSNPWNVKTLVYLLSSSHRESKLLRHVALTSRLFHITPLELTMARPAPISVRPGSANVHFQRVPGVTHRRSNSAGFPSTGETPRNFDVWAHVLSTHRGNVYARLPVSRWRNTRNTTHRRRARASDFPMSKVQLPKPDSRSETRVTVCKAVAITTNA